MKFDTSHDMSPFFFTFVAYTYQRGTRNFVGSGGRDVANLRVFAGGID